VQEEKRTRHVSAMAADGGAILRFLNLYNKVSGGRLELAFSGPAASSDGAGDLVLRDFRILDEKALKQVLEQDGGVGRGGRDASDLKFSKLRIPFRRQGDLVALDEAYLRGLLIGGTGSGTVNLRQGKLVIAGTLVPAYGINNIAGAVPIVGRILGGRKNEGLVGITYRLSGSFDDPRLQMNPMSAVTPGIFRRIFEYR
jgi:hypothetical protein